MVIIMIPITTTLVWVLPFDYGTSWPGNDQEMLQWEGQRKWYKRHGRHELEDSTQLPVIGKIMSPSRNTPLLTIIPRASNIYMDPMVYSFSESWWVEVCHDCDSDCKHLSQWAFAVILCHTPWMIGRNSTVHRQGEFDHYGQRTIDRRLPSCNATP